MTIDNRISPGLNFLLAVACGIIVANIYYSQPIVSLIGESLSLPLAAVGLIVTLTQVGYGLGVLLLVPLGDLVENRKLILINLGFNFLALLCLALSTKAIPFFVAAFAVGLLSSMVQIIIPYAASLASDLHRGRVVGNCTSGIMLGIMLSRPTASFITNAWDWHWVFYFSMVLTSLLGLVLFVKLPKRTPPAAKLSYVQILSSLVSIFISNPVLRRRGFYQACQFGAFSLFWTTTPIVLARDFHLSQAGIALFALAGVTGAIAAPIAGRLADRGWSQPMTGMGLCLVGFSYILTHFAPNGTTLGLGIFVLAGILLDAGVSTVLVLGQRAIFSLAADSRSRLNGLFIAMIFVGGATGSALGAFAYSRGGWTASSWIGFTLPMIALAFFSTEFRKVPLTR